MLKKWRGKELYIGIFSGIFIFIIGFGMMNIFWIFSLKQDGLPGLYDYTAATIGDGLCFPVLVGALLYNVLKNNILNRRQHIVTNIFGITMTLIGILVQISWLRDDNIKLNWTIPSPHHFNVAGWYHAFFFALMFGIFGTLLSKMYLIRVISRNKQRQIGSIEKINCFLIWFSGSFFLLLHFFDDYKEKYDIVVLLEVCALIIFIFAVCLNGITIKKIMLEEVIGVFSGVLSALGLSITISGNINGLSILIISSFFLAFAYVFQCRNDLTTVIVNCILISFPMFSLNLALSSMEKRLSLIPIFVLTIVAPCIIAQIQKKNMPKEIHREINKYIFDGTAFSVLLSFTIVFFELNIDNLEIITGPISLLVELAVATYAKSSIKKNFEYLKTIEDSRKNFRKAPDYVKILTDQKIKSYLLIVMVGVGAFIYLLLMLSSYIELKFFWNMNDFVLYREEIILVAGLLMVILVSLFVKNISGREIQKSHSMLIFILFVIAYLLLTVTIYCFRRPFVFDNNVTLYFSIFMIFGSSFMVTESFYSNLVGIRGIEKNSHVIIASGIIFVGNISAIAVSLLPTADLRGNRSSDLIFVFISVVGCLMATLLFPLLMGKIVQCEIPDMQIATTRPLGGITQNGFLVWILVLLGGVIPVYFSAISKNTIYLACGIISISYNIYWPLCYCMRNNVEHLKKRIRENLNDGNQSENNMVYFQLSRLAKHLKRQNIATFIALLCYCLVPLCIEMAAEFRAHGEIKGLLKKYIPDIKIDRY